MGAHPCAVQSAMSVAGFQSLGMQTAWQISTVGVRRQCCGYSIVPGKQWKESFNMQARTTKGSTYLFQIGSMRRHRCRSWERAERLSGLPTQGSTYYAYRRGTSI